MKFSISLVVKAAGPKTLKEFPFHDVPTHKERGVDVGKDDILQNFVPKEELSMNGGIPWRGPRERSKHFMQMVVEAVTDQGDVVADCTAATGNICFKFVILHFFETTVEVSNVSIWWNSLCVFRFLHSSLSCNWTPHPGV